MQSRIIRWGIIGCGDVTEVKSGPAFQKAQNSALVAVMRRNGAKARDYAERHGVSRWYDDAQQLIDDPEVDAVYIATPPSSHAEYAKRVAMAGKPVYVEKPMAVSYAECRGMIDACASVGTPLFTAYYRRALERFVAIRRLVLEGAIGEVRTVSIRLRQPLFPEDLDPATLSWRVKPEIAGGGRFVDLASHMLDFLDYTLGPIATVRGHSGNQAGRYPAEDIVTGSFAFESGVLGSGTWCFTTADAVDETEIAGSLGTIRYSTFDYRPVLLWTRDGVKEMTFEAPAHIQQPLIQIVVNALNGTAEAVSTGETAARTSWVMDQMLAS